MTKAHNQKFQRFKKILAINLLIASFLVADEEIDDDEDVSAFPPTTYGIYEDEDENSEDGNYNLVDFNATGAVFPKLYTLVSPSEEIVADADEDITPKTLSNALSDNGLIPPPEMPLELPPKVEAPQANAPAESPVQTPTPSPEAPVNTSPAPTTAAPETKAPVEPAERAPTQPTPLVPPTGPQPDVQLIPVPPAPAKEPKKTEATKATSVKTESAKETEPKPAPTYLIKFNNVKMSVVLNFISKITNKNFIFDDQELDFNVSIISNEPTSVENIIAALLQELRVRGLEMIEVGNNFIIHKNVNINSPAIVVKSDQKAPKDAQIITQVFQLKYVDPASMVSVIRPMLSENSIVEAVPNTRHLIITGLVTNIDRIRQLLDSLDTATASLDVGEYVARNIPISQAIQIVEKLMTPIAKDVPLVLSAHPLKNAVYIASTPLLVERTIDVFRKVDSLRGKDREGTGPETEEERMIREAEEEARQAKGAFTNEPLGSTQATKFYLHKLQYRKGDQIQQALQSIANSLQQTATQGSDLITTINSVQWIESTNTLVFTGTNESIEKVRELIDEIDTPVPQVLIEMLVIETNIDDALNFGVDFGARFSQSNMAGSEGFFNSNSGVNTVLSNPLTFSTLDPAPLANSQGFNMGIMGRNITFNNGTFSTLGALVSALNTDQKTNVILNPKIVVEDNTPAKIFVGINTAFQTQAIANDLGNIVTSNFEYRDVGSTLSVTPLISNNGIITLDIQEEVSSLVAANVLTGGILTTGNGAQVITTIGAAALGANAASSSSNNPGPTTRKSTSQTRIHLPDKFFVILSGQIRTEYDTNVTQVPCLGGLPVIGAMFTQERKIESKRNLLLFIRPQIINIRDIDPVTKRQQDIYNEHNRMRNRWDYQVDEALDFFNLKYPFLDTDRHYRY